LLQLLPPVIMAVGEIHHPWRQFRVPSDLRSTQYGVTRALKSVK
jgi:hypothetical protein